MYVEMLSSALEAWDLDLSGQELVDHVLACRARMLATTTADGGSAYEALAGEIGYDRALIHLCEDVGINTGPAAFDQPQAERIRLEEALASVTAINLVALSRERSGSTCGDARW